MEKKELNDSPITVYLTIKDLSVIRNKTHIPKELIKFVMLENNMTALTLSYSQLVELIGYIDDVMSHTIQFNLARKLSRIQEKLYVFLDASGIKPDIEGDFLSERLV